MRYQGLLGRRTAVLILGDLGIAINEDVKLADSLFESLCKIVPDKKILHEILEWVLSKYSGKAGENALRDMLGKLEKMMDRIDKYKQWKTECKLSRRDSEDLQLSSSDASLQVAENGYSIFENKKTVRIMPKSVEKSKDFGSSIVQILGTDQAGMKKRPHYCSIL